jgi:hypothetical protein
MKDLHLLVGVTRGIAIGDHNVPFEVDQPELERAPMMQEVLLPVTHSFFTAIRLSTGPPVSAKASLA